MIKIETDKILQKEMDRKAFLRNTGIAFGVLTGFTAIIGKLNLLDGQIKPSQSNAGYSSSAYGGDTLQKPVNS